MIKLRLVCLVVFLAGISFFSYAQITLTIEQALDIAEENNPQMKNAKLNFERTRFTLEAQRASLKPQFSMSINPFNYSQTRSFDTRYSDWYTNKSLSSNGTFQAELPLIWTDGTLSLTNRFGWQDNETMTQEGANNNKAFFNNLALRFTQPIFTYNRQKMQMQRYEFDHENSGISYALQRLRTEQNITSQFYSVYLAQNNLDISMAEYENSKSNYEIISAQVEADLAAREELYQAEVNLASAESSVETYDVSLKNAKDQLKQTLGIPLSEEINVLADIVVIPVLFDEEKAIQSGLLSRMELRQREISMDLADLDMITTKALDEFRGNISLSLGLNGDNPQFSNIYQNPTQSPGIAISFSIPIFDWGQRKARIQAAKTAQTIAQLEYENQKVDIELGIRSSLRRLSNLSTQINIAEKNIRNAQLTYDLNQIRYREGDLTGLQMSQYQTQLSNARTNLVSAQITYKNELLNLKILTLYDFENEQPIIPVKELQNITMY